MIFGKSSRSPEQSLKLSLVDGFLCSLMVGAGESYLPAYVISIGMGQVLAGLLSSLPLVSGAFLQLLTPRLLHKVNSHKYWVVILTSLQTLTFVPLIYFSLNHTPGFWMLFSILTLYWGTGFSAGTAWTFWMGNLVPSAESTRYFAFRTRLNQIGVLVGIVGGGIALHNDVEIGPFTSVFSLLFVFAFGCRLLSTVILSKKMYKSEWVSQDQSRSWRESWNLFWNGRHKKKFFMYLVPFQMALYVTSPFVTPYMLAQLKMNYGQYMGAIAALFVGKIAALSMIQRKAAHYSGFSMLVAGLVLLSPMPLLWALGESYTYVLGLQLIGGISLACFEMGLALIFFKDLRQEEKVSVLTMYNLLNSVAVIAGTFIGGEILWSLGELKQSYWMLYALGGVLRIAFCFPLVRQAWRWKKISESSSAATPGTAADGSLPNAS